MCVSWGKRPPLPAGTAVMMIQKEGIPAESCGCQSGKLVALFSYEIPINSVLKDEPRQACVIEGLLEAAQVNCMLYNFCFQYLFPRLS